MNTDDWWEDDSWPRESYLSDLRDMREYKHLVARINELFPDLTENQRRSILLLVADTCHNCHAANSSCRCWDDS